MNQDIIKQLAGGLVVSCQAFASEPMYSVDTMVRMAIASQNGGACAIRSSWPENISAIRKNVSIPIFGINKIMPTIYNKIEDVVITPSVEAALAVYYAGSDIIAVDCTERNRSPESIAALIKGIKKVIPVPIMGEVSTLEEGIKAESYGVDIISTTIAGYTSYSRQLELPDFELVRDLVRSCHVPINAEGRYNTPQLVKQAFECGAWTVTVGSAITRPDVITKSFVSQMK